MRRTNAIACRELVELATDYLEGALRSSARRRVERHVAGCEGCAGYLEQIRTTVAVLRAAGSTAVRSG